MCAVCNKLHDVQVHHITPVSEGGSDDVSNAIPLCPNCHNEVHAHYVSGRTTRLYTESELRGHLERTIRLAATQTKLRPGTRRWNADVKLIKFYAQCVDRPAFRTLFHQELSFSDLDQALEDTALAISTGYWRTRDGAVIARSKGKSQVVNPTWRGKLDEAVAAIDAARGRLRHGLQLDRDFYHLGHDRWMYDELDAALRGDRRLGAEIDRLRNQAIDLVNEVLAAIGSEPLNRIGSSHG